MAPHMCSHACTCRELAGTNITLYPHRSRGLMLGQSRGKELQRNSSVPFLSHGTRIRFLRTESPTCEKYCPYKPCLFAQVRLHLLHIFSHCPHTSQMITFWCLELRKKIIFTEFYCVLKTSKIQRLAK